MRQFIAFTKKDVVELIRSQKLLIFIIVFVILGIMNPIVAKVLPSLIVDVMPADMALEVPTPSIFTSYEQFFNNVPQIGVIVMIILFGGIIEQELSKGTLIILLTKGLKRWIVIMSKFVTTTVLWTICYALSFISAYIYGNQLFGKTDIPNLAFSTIMVWVFGCLMIAALFLGSVLFKFNNSGIAIAGFFFIFMIPFSYIIPFDKINPLILMSRNMKLLYLEMAPSEFLAPCVTAIFLTIVMLIGTILVFNKREI